MTQPLQICRSKDAAAPACHASQHCSLVVAGWPGAGAGAPLDPGVPVAVCCTTGSVGSGVAPGPPAPVPSTWLIGVCPGAVDGDAVVWPAGAAPGAGTGAAWIGVPAVVPVLTGVKVVAGAAELLGVLADGLLGEAVVDAADDVTAGAVELTGTADVGIDGVRVAPGVADVTEGAAELARLAPDVSSGVRTCPGAGAYAAGTGATELRDGPAVDCAGAADVAGAAELPPDTLRAGTEVLVGRPLVVAGLTVNTPGAGAGARQLRNVLGCSMTARPDSSL